MSEKIKPEQNKSGSKSLKIVILMLAFTMIGSLFYIYKVSDRSKNMIISLREEKSNILKDLEKSKLFLDQMMTTNKSLSKKLSLEQEKVKKLILDLKTQKVTEKTIVVYKQSATNVDDRIKVLLNEIAIYKKRIDSTNVVLSNERTKNDTLVVSNKTLSKKVNDASKLYFYNLKTSSYKIKGSGKQIETNKASRIDMLKINFTIAENNLAKPATKEFYIQIIDGKNNVIGANKGIQNFASGTLNYSTTFKLQYENKTINAEAEIPVSNLEKGAFYVNVFDKSKLVLKTTLTLE